jgi:hypothetical protein
MFAGIGSGIVALKKIGLQIKKIIHVELDPVATHGMFLEPFFAKKVVIVVWEIQYLTSNIFPKYLAHLTCLLLYSL